MEQLHHFNHHHPLSLVHLPPYHKTENSDEEDEDGLNEEDKDDFDEDDNNDHHVGQCNMCKEQIYPFHLCYYECKSCEYVLHKFCAELPTTHQSHPLHSGHNLTLSTGYQRTNEPSAFFSFGSEWMCCVCNIKRKNFFNYHCSVCKINIDIICATMSEQRIDHPSHPGHKLERMFGHMVSMCVACGNKHQGEFFQCLICPTFRIHVGCILMPDKLLIQRYTNETFTHSHPLTLAYSFPYADQIARFYPMCRVCDGKINFHLWIYKCDKCLYYVHVDCATSKRESFMSIFLPASLGKTFKNFEDNEHPDLLHCPFQDEGDNLLKHYFSKRKRLLIVEEMLNHFSHQHPLVLVDTQTSPDNELVISCHDPMKKIQLLCDGCVKPITTIPFYKCSQQCGFVLHDWCTDLPTQIQNYAGHPKHPLLLLPKIPGKLFGVFYCDMCELPSNGFVYGCTMCEYYIDINCAFIPDEITHEAHPNHLLSKINYSPLLSGKYCNACESWMIHGSVFHCHSCDFYLHIECALLLNKTIRHKCDKHPLTLRYVPVENHISEYFCEVCEDKFTPWRWFYHCTTCDYSMHAACAPLILQYEQATYVNGTSVYKFLNVKFGGTLEIKGHSHRLVFAQGIEDDGQCIECDSQLRYKMIFKCLECEFAIHYVCVDSYVNGSSSLA